MRLSYIPYLPNELEFAEKTKESILEYNPNMEVILINTETFLNINKSKKCCWGFINKVIPDYINKNIQTGFYWVESGVKITRNFDDWIQEYAPDKPQDRIYWMGFCKLLSNYRVGSKVVYFPDKIIKNFFINDIPLVHLDRLLQKKQFNAITSSTIKKGNSILDNGGVFKLFNKPSNTGTKHSKYLYE
tara:strand:+ start:5229 stop:5792 length:564 start_codon:yes stop_codon:yes gene_type:complete